MMPSTLIFSPYTAPLARQKPKIAVQISMALRSGCLAE